MTLTADDEVTLVEIAVIVLGVVLTWAVYQIASHAAAASGPDIDPRPPGATFEPGEENRG